MSKSISIAALVQQMQEQRAILVKLHQQLNEKKVAEAAGTVGDTPIPDPWALVMKLEHEKEESARLAKLWADHMNKSVLGRADIPELLRGINEGVRALHPDPEGKKQSEIVKVLKSIDTGTHQFATAMQGLEVAHSSAVGELQRSIDKQDATLSEINKTLGELLLLQKAKVAEALNYVALPSVRKAVRELVRLQETSDETQNEILEQPLSELDIPPHLVVRLKGYGIETVADLMKYTPREFLELKRIGRMALCEVINALRKHGLKLKADALPLKGYQ